MHFLCLIALQQTCTYSETANSYFNTTSSRLSASLRDMDLYLHQNIAVDLPTGQTPAKHSWPAEFPTSTTDDPLEQSRQIALDHLRRPILSSLNQHHRDPTSLNPYLEMEEGEGVDRLDEVSWKGPRVSSALAARKASRRSSVLTVTNPLLVTANLRRN